MEIGDKTECGLVVKKCQVINCNEVGEFINDVTGFRYCKIHRNKLHGFIKNAKGQLQYLRQLKKLYEFDITKIGVE